jgi:uncharacterized FlgJ-related protein
MRTQPKAVVCLFVLLLLVACSDAPEPATATAAATTPAATESPVDPAQPQPTVETGFDKEVLVFGGTAAVSDWLDSADGWGGIQEDGSGGVPYALFTAINPGWTEVSKTLPVEQKKRLFYRFLLPLVLHANKMIMDRRVKVLEIQRKLGAGEAFTDDELQLLHTGLVTLRVTDAETAAAVTEQTPELGAYLDEVLYKLDEFPPGLALGQGAYESGYGTSRFALAGNALFGQWTWGDEGIKPEEQRADTHGDHRIAAFDWPFDSVRSYVINLMTHPSYDELRRLRAELRAQGKPLDSLVLADGLIKYSERGQEYVDTLKGMIRRNGLERADHVGLRDEKMRFLLVTPDEAAALDLEKRIEEMRDSGELEQIYERMRLD